MLSAAHRMRNGAQFSATTRGGARAGRKTLVFYALPYDATTLVGFIVSKAVGNSVMRNKVQRKLRHIAANSLSTHQHGYYFVVRALPAAATASFAQLESDYTSALTSVLAKLERATTHEPAAQRPDAGTSAQQLREEL